MSAVLTWKDVPCLHGAGALGHTMLVTCITEGRERLGLHTCDAQSAVKYHDENVGRGNPGHIYRRKGNGWERLTRAAAVIA